MKTEHFRQPLSLMRFLAVILITNSHIGPLYPPHLQFLSTGGALGNSLFFFCSGFALYLSNRDTGFAPWAIRRFTRIYPSLWIFMTVCFLGGIQSFRLPDIIIPTFWFLQAIFVFYVFFFYSIKFFERQLWKVCAAFIFPLLVTYFYVPHHEWIIENTEHNHFLHWYFYYIIMLFGAVAAQRRTNTESPSSIARPLSAVLLIVTVYYSLKIYILHSASPIYNVQLCIPILLTLFSIYMFRLFERLSNIGTKNGSDCKLYCKSYIRYLHRTIRDYGLLHPIYFSLWILRFYCCNLIGRRHTELHFEIHNLLLKKHPVKTYHTDSLIDSHIWMQFFS